MAQGEGRAEGVNCSPEWLSAIGVEAACAQWPGWPMLSNLRYARAHERKVAPVFRDGLGKCGSSDGAATPRPNRSGTSGGSTYLPLERTCSAAVENERVGAELQVHQIEVCPVSWRVPAPPEQRSLRAHRLNLQARATSLWRLAGGFRPN